MRAQAVRETRISFFSAVRRRPRPERLHHHETHDHEARASRSRESGDARDGRAALSAVFFFVCVQRASHADIHLRDPDACAGPVRGPHTARPSRRVVYIIYFLL